MAGIHKMLVRRANREDPDQSDRDLPWLSRNFDRQQVLEIWEHLLYATYKQIIWCQNFDFFFFLLVNTSFFCVCVLISDFIHYYVLRHLSSHTEKLYMYKWSMAKWMLKIDNKVPYLIGFKTWGFLSKFRVWNPQGSDHINVLRQSSFTDWKAVYVSKEAWPNKWKLKIDITIFNWPQDMQFSFQI